MSLAIDYTPLEIFYPFHQSRTYQRAVIGGYGSGKSTAACAEAIALGLEQPGSEFLICRKTIPALRDTTERTFINLLPQEFLDQCDIGRMGGHLEHVTFPNGSIYYFRGMDDWRKHRSMNLAFILYDEADEIDEESYVGMLSRIRQTRPTKEARSRGYTAPITRRGILVACNPQGKNWIYEWFVGPKAKRGTEWFKSSSLDNPTLPLDYVQSLLDMPEPWVRQFVFCSFDDHGGAIYPNWDESYVKPRPDYRREGHFRMGFDPGTHAGNAAVWLRYDRELHIYVAVATYNERGLAASQHAAKWRSIEATHRMPRVAPRIADPVISTRDRGSNIGLDEQYRKLGFLFQSGPKRIEDRLPALGELIHQRRFAVTPDCMELFEQIRNYRWSDLTPDQRSKGTEAKPHKKDVDLVDAAQYAVARHVAPPRLKPRPRSDEEAMRQEIWANVRAARTRTATPDTDLGNVPV